MLLRPRKRSSHSCSCDYCSESLTSSHCKTTESKDSLGENRDSVIVKVEAMEKDEELEQECEEPDDTPCHKTHQDEQDEWNTDDQLSPSAMRSASTQTNSEGSPKTNALRHSQPMTSPPPPRRSPLTSPSPPIQYIRIKQERLDEDEERASTTPSPNRTSYNERDRYNSKDHGVEDWRGMKEFSNSASMIYHHRDSDSISPPGYPRDNAALPQHYNSNHSPMGSYIQDSRTQSGVGSPSGQSTPSPRHHDVKTWHSPPYTTHDKLSEPAVSPRNAVASDSYAPVVSYAQKRPNNLVSLDYYAYPNDEEECLWQKFLRYRHKPHRKATYGKRSLNEEESLFIQYKRIRNSKEDDVAYDSSRGVRDKIPEVMDSRADLAEDRASPVTLNNNHLPEMTSRDETSQRRNNSYDDKPNGVSKHASQKKGLGSREEEQARSAENRVLESESFITEAEGKDNNNQPLPSKQRVSQAGRMDALVNAIKESKGLNDVDHSEVTSCTNPDDDKPVKVKEKVKRKQSESTIRRREVEHHVEEESDSRDLTEKDRVQETHDETELTNESSQNNNVEGQSSPHSQSNVYNYENSEDATAHAPNNAMQRELYRRHAGAEGHEVQGMCDYKMEKVVSYDSRGSPSHDPYTDPGLQRRGAYDSRDLEQLSRDTADIDDTSDELMRLMENKQCKDSDVACYVNGLLSLPGMKETRYPVSYGELRRRANSPENLSRVEMISYVRQSKTSGRLLLDRSNVMSSGKRSKPTILSRMCEGEARALADGIHRLNMEYFPVMSVGQRAAISVKESLQRQGGFWEEALKKKIHTISNARSVLRELQDVFMECKEDKDMRKYELASHNFGVRNAMNNFHLFDRALAEFSFNLQNSFDGGS